MNRAYLKNPLVILLINILAFIVAYYVSILLHEWLGHGTAAWILGQKSNPFDITYGGGLLLHVDERVDYDKLIAMNHGISAAIIGISGITVTLILFLVSLFLLARSIIQKHNVIFIFFYWIVVINMIAIIQYLVLTTFSSEGDVGRFIHGLNISPLWIFIPGTVFVILAIWRILSVETPKAYACMPIQTMLGRRLLLLITLAVMFLLIYTHGYNPISDKGTNQFSRILAIISILLVPILFLCCDPSYRWVKEKVRKYQQHL